jgi:hypothetical protein
MRKFAIGGYRTREAAEKAAAVWAEIYPEEDMEITLECVFYVLYLPCTDDDCDHEECHQ